MKIDEIIDRIPFQERNVKTDSRKVAPGDIFIAIKGTRYDGHEFISEALEKVSGENNTRSELLEGKSLTEVYDKYGVL